MKKIILPIVLLAMISSLFSQQINEAESPFDQIETIDTVKLNLDGAINTFDVLPTAVSERCVNFFKSLMTTAASKAYNDLLDGSPIKINDDKVKNQVVKQTKQSNYMEK